MHRGAHPEETDAVLPQSKDRTDVRPPEPARWHRLRRYARALEPVVGLALFVVAIAALHRELRGHTLREIGRTLEGLPAGQLALALGLAALSYGVLTLYDQLAVRYAGGGCRTGPWPQARS